MQIVCKACAFLPIYFSLKRLCGELEIERVHDFLGAARNSLSKLNSSSEGSLRNSCFLTYDPVILILLSGLTLRRFQFSESSP